MDRVIPFPMLKIQEMITIGAPMVYMPLEVVVAIFFVFNNKDLMKRSGHVAR